MPREISQLERNNSSVPISVKRTENIQAVLNIIDHMIAGKRFGEFDSKKQMFLFGCQTKIDDMQHGYFTKEGLMFLDETIDALMNTCILAKKDIESVLGGEKKNESNDQYTYEPVEEKKLLEKK